MNRVQIYRNESVRYARMARRARFMRGSPFENLPGRQIGPLGIKALAALALMQLEIAQAAAELHQPHMRRPG